jgi:hypothetical protein
MNGPGCDAVTMAKTLEAEQKWAEIHQAYARLQRKDPAGWQDYLRELAELDAFGEPTTTAAEE